MRENYEQYSAVCRTIVNPVRQRIIRIIGRDTLNVSQIQRELDISMSNLSNHLSALHRIGVLSRKKDGNFIYYYLTETEILEVLEHMQRVIASITAKRSHQMTEI